MTDDVDIRSGGVVAVDTGELRGAADGFAAMASELRDIDETLRETASRLSEVADPMLDTAPDRAFPLAWRVDALASEAARFDERLRTLATIYEVVDLGAARAAAAAGGDSASLTLIDGRLLTLAAYHPDAFARAVAQQASWAATRSFELAGQAGAAASVFGPLGFLGASAGVLQLGAAVRVVGRGTIPRGEVLVGPPAAVSVTMLGGGARSGAAPATLQAAATRIPSGDGAARVRVERYTMTDGSKRFAVYIAGTRGAGPTEAWDMRSNEQLYLGQRSASYDATAEALRQAGAEPGDDVYDFGHSQGAMIAAHLALEGGYETRALITFGSPVEADVGPDTLSVELRHTDDPVVALAGGGSPAGVGASGSFIAERVADPIGRPSDLTLTAHHLTAYERTAALLDASPDPRMSDVRTMLDELDSAAEVEVFEFSARRDLADVSPAGASAVAAE